MPSDARLGEALRLNRPIGVASRQQLDSMVRDLLGSDDSLLAPLQHLIARPSFLAVEPVSGSLAELILARDQLLAQLGETYHPKALDRLKAFLEGYLNLPPTAADPAPQPEPVIWGDDPMPGQRQSPKQPPSAPVTSPPQPHHADRGPSEPGQSRGGAGPDPSPPTTQTLEPWPTSTPSQRGAEVKESSLFPAQQHSTHDPSQSPLADEGVPQSPRQRRNLPLFMGLGLVAGLGIGIASRIPSLCRPLGLCPAPSAPGSKATSPSAMALERAQKAADALASAATLPAYEAALDDLDRELLRLSGDPLTPEQLAQRKKLEGAASDGRQRVGMERQEAQVVAGSSERIDALPSLPASQQESEKQAIAGALRGVPERSLAYGAAQAQLKRLEALPAPSQPSEPTTAPNEPATSQPEPTPQPAQTPRWRPSAPSSGGQGSWSPAQAARTGPLQTLAAC